ncbi:unnamed protein product [Orchesella dallaii]|uniref:CABIT domain-containing protein n=1 Tax=Orchesella dallaii TaxID=48710 RepID=A0ABP1QIM7_9HEXA
MANRTDVSDLLSSCRWSDEGSYLGEIAKSGFPIVAKVSRGQYQNIGQPSFSNPSLVSHVLLVSAGKKLSVCAQCVKFKNARQRVVPFGPTLSIPQDFEGHFEILSEDGRAVPCIQTVSALTRKFPDACLVRETLKAYKPDAKSAVVIPPQITNHPTKHGGEPPDSMNKLQGLIQPSYKISDKTRLIQPGEILVLVGEVSVPTGKKVSRYLRCFDSKGQTVYLNSAQKGKFSPLARQDSISGVHTTKNILTKRLPLMVRLVDGKPPVMPSAKTSSFKFVPELRLFSTIQEELIFAMPLSQNWKESQSIVPLPLSVPLKFQTCRNMGDVDHTKEFSRIHEKARTLVDQSKNLIQIYDINLKKELRFDGRQWKAYAPPLFLTPSSTDPIIPINGNQQNGNSSSPGENNCPKPEKNNTATVISNLSSTYDEIPDAQDYEDIDEIYDYVRGIKPPPPKLLAGQNNVDSTSNVVSTNNERNKEIPLKLDCNKASQYNKNKNSNGHNKSSHVSKNNGNRVLAHHQHHHHNSPNHDKLSGVPTSPTTIVTITTPPGRNEPDLIVGSVPPPPVPKHRVPYGRLLSSKSLERLDASDSDYDEPPPPPPIETIPSKQNLFFLNPPGGVSVSVSNKNSKNLPKLESESFTIAENEAEITNEIHNNGNSVQIQIRSTENPQKLKSSCVNGTPYGYTSSQTGFTSITTSSTGRDNNGLHSTHNNMSHGHHSHHNPYSHPYSLGSTGNSINTTPTNTSGSGGSYGSSSSGGDKKGKPKQHLYVKHNSTNSSNHCNSPLSGGGLLAADLNGKGLSGSPANRIVFRRSPIFDCRYKSMNDLNRSSLESGVSSSGGAGALGGGGVGASSQRHRCYPHSGNHNAFNNANSSNMTRDSPLASSGLNLNLNLLNLNMNLKASGKSKGIFRPKSLTNLVFNDDSYTHHYGGSNGSGGGLIGGVKKKLTDMVVPSHHHAAHTPPPPPVEILQKVPLKCSQRTRKSSTPTQHTPTLYL